MRDDPVPIVQHGEASCPTMVAPGTPLRGVIIEELEVRANIESLLSAGVIVSDRATGELSPMDSEAVLQMPA